jgi:hypothetical protein
MGTMPGNWQVSVVGSVSNDVWNLRIRGPQPRSYELYGPDGQHEPRFVRALLTDSLASAPVHYTSLPDPVANPWARLSRGGGTQADIGAVLGFIIDNWAKNADEFAIERKWGRLSIESERRSAALIALEDREHRKEFDALVDGVAQGSLILEFFGALDALPSALKRVAYVRGYESATELNKVLILHALSREPRAFISDALETFPKDRLIDTLRSFIESPDSALKLSGRADVANLDKSPIETLFALGSEAVSEQNRHIRELPATLRMTLANLANRLISTLPNEQFGRFARLRMSIFTILAVTNKADAEFAKGVLLKEPEPAVLEALARTEDYSALSSLFDQLSVSAGEERPTYTANLIDLLRTSAPDVISEATDTLTPWSTSKSALLSVASKAALLSIRRIDANNFEQAFLNAARATESDVVAQWIATNPGFLEHISLKRLRRDLWRSLVISVLTSQPRLARELIQAKLQETDATRYWQDSIEILATAATSESEQMLGELLLEELQSNSQIREQRPLSGSAARIVAESQFWNVATRLDENNRLRLFDAIREKIGPVQVERLLRSGLTRNENEEEQDLKVWITNEFVPYLLLEGFVGPDVGRTFDDLSLKEGLAGC